MGQQERHRAQSKLSGIPRSVSKRHSEEAQHDSRNHNKGYKTMNTEERIAAHNNSNLTKNRKVAFKAAEQVDTTRVDTTKTDAKYSGTQKMLKNTKVTLKDAQDSKNKAMIFLHSKEHVSRFTGIDASAKTLSNAPEKQKAAPQIGDVVNL